MKVLETLIVPLALTLILNPSPKWEEVLQSGSLLPKREKELGDESKPSQNMFELLLNERRNFYKFQLLD